MDTLELIKDAALFGGTIPEERIQEVRDYFDKEQTKMPSLPNDNKINLWANDTSQRNINGDYERGMAAGKEIGALWLRDIVLKNQSTNKTELSGMPSEEEIDKQYPVGDKAIKEHLGYIGGLNKEKATEIFKLHVANMQARSAIKWLKQSVDK